MKKSMARSLAFVLILTMFSVCQTQAASRQTGTYYKTYKATAGFEVDSDPMYCVTVNKIKNKKITFQISYFGINGSPIYQTKVITAKLNKDNRVSFKWEDTWENSGVGKMKLCNGYVKLKMTVTQSAANNRYTLATGNKYIKIKKQNNNTKLNRW